MKNAAPCAPQPLARQAARPPARPPVVLLAILACLLLSAPVAPSRAASVCAAAGGAPGPLIGLGDAGFGGIGPGAGSLSSQSPNQLVSGLVGASPPPRSCQAPASGRTDAAGSSASPGVGEPASLPAIFPGQAAGNPVDLVTGNKYQRVLDVVLPDPESGLQAALLDALGADAAHALGEAWQPFEPLRLAFTRHYNSRFDAAGPLGPGWRHGYETALARLRGPAGVELQVVQADGRRLVFRADPKRSGTFAGLASGSGSIVEQPGASLPWAWRWVDGRVLRFDLQGALARIEAPDGDRLSLQRDPRGRLAEIRDASGRALELAYAGERLSAIVLPDGLRIRYEYDVHGVLAAARYPDGRALRHHYEDLQAFHLLTGIERPDGRRSRYRYDDLRRVIESRPEDGQDTGALVFGWAPPPVAGAVGRTTVTEGERVSTWRWQVDLQTGSAALLSMDGQACTSCPPLPASSPGVISGPTQPQRVVTYGVFGLPAEARITGQARRPDEPSTTLSMHLRWQRHGAGPLAGKLAWVERLSPDGRAARTVFRHDKARRLIGIERPEGLTETIDRDALGRAVVRIGPDLARRAARFDATWRLVEWRIRDAVTTVAWNDQGLPSSIAWPAGDRWALDWRAGEVSIRSDRGWLASAVGDRTAVAPAHGASPGKGSPRGVPVALAGAAPHPFVVDGAGRRTDLRHDDFGRLVEERSADAGWRRYRHDPWGRVERIDSGGGFVEIRRHDLAGRLIEREQLGGGERTVTRFAWQGELLTGIDHPGQRTRVVHDALGRVSEIVDEIGGTAHRWSFARDARERIVSRGLPGGGRIDYDYDRQGRPVAMRFAASPGAAGVPIVDAVRYRGGRAIAWRYGNGTRFERRDDAAGRPLEWTWRGREPLPAWRYRWRADGLPASISDSSQERRLGWDALGRLIVDERRASPRENEPVREFFAWDLAGDLRYARGRDGRDWAADRDLAPHDADGRARRHGGLELRRGAAGRIVEVVDQARPVARYAYNAAGERISRRVGASETGYLYRGRALAAETGQGGGLRRHYLRWMGAPVAIVDLQDSGPVVSWLHADHLGTPHAATDAAGRRVWQGEYLAFGGLAAEGGPLRQPLRFAGQHHDPETGLHDNYQRSYDPATGRYLEPDPLGLAGGLNRFAYADGNPVLGGDPLGLILFAFDGTNNAATPPGQDDQSNVRKFFELYEGKAWYMTGVGLDDPGSGILTNALDPLNGNTARARVDFMLGELDAYMGDGRIGETIAIDVVGFSRGAAMARDFVNRVARLDAERYWWLKGFCVDLRFLGLWDTVAQFGQNGSDNQRWQLGIPSAVGAAYHAVALNEHRSLFPLEGAAGSAVIERGFVGSHADVGGGNAEGDLSDISLAWMTRMAAQAGVSMKALPADWQRVDAPILHDRNYDAAGDRRVDVRDASGRIVSRTTQRAAPIPGMDWSASQPFLIVPPSRERDAYGKLSIVGSVDLDAYSRWLAENYGVQLAAR
ncbi:RHS repeat-associated core domain-containing protein [Zeimonas arvi]|uniref:DUF2235 domain-containing protein n=1 Tax=Zeimonas arvi TaxID=2498847 RepID=A0A5C8NTZ8_9BURK|nr:RHS repeat-associated core domain-containing protein [Zeimonas arvi]TXL64635.1 hypothetical protein FHP08_12860 [Zeimonas arvi]